MKTIKTFLCAFCALLLLQTMTQVGSAFDWGALQQEEAATKKKSELPTQGKGGATAKATADWAFRAMQLPSTMVLTYASGEGALSLLQLGIAEIPELPPLAQRLQGLCQEKNLRELHFALSEQNDMVLALRFGKTVEKQTVFELLTGIVGDVEWEERAEGIYRYDDDLVVCLASPASGTDIVVGVPSNYLDAYYTQMYTHAPSGRESAPSLREELSAADIAVWLKWSDRSRKMTSDFYEGNIDIDQNLLAQVTDTLISLNLNNGLRGHWVYSSAENAQKYLESLRQGFRLLADGLAELEGGQPLCEPLRKATVKQSGKETVAVCPGNGREMLRGIVKILHENLIKPIQASSLQKKREVMCTNNLKQLTLELIFWANEHDDFYPTPEEFRKAAQDYGFEKCLECPVNGGNYLYVGDGLKMTSVSHPEKAIVLVSPAESQGRLQVAFADGHVSWENTDHVRLAVLNKKAGELPILE